MACCQLGRPKLSSWWWLFGCLFTFPLRVGSVLTLANLNWRTADLCNAVFLAENCQESPCSISVAPGEYTISNDAVQGVRDGKVDFFLECWSNCSQPGVVAEPTNLTGSYGLYAPAWLLKKEPTLRNISTWKEAVAVRGGAGSRLHVMIRGYEAQVFGVLDTWTNDIDNLHGFYSSNGFDALNESIRHFSSESDLDSAIIACLNAQTPFIFTYWEPSVMVAEKTAYQIERLVVPETWTAHFPVTYIQKVRRADHAAVEHLYRFNRFSMPSLEMQSLLQRSARLVSPAVPSSAIMYARGLQQAASDHECKRTGRRCRDNFVNVWPKAREPTMPSKVLVLIKECKGMVDVIKPSLRLADGATCNSDAEENLRFEGLRPYSDIDGYSVRHVLRTLGQLGYRESDVTFRCVQTMGQLMSSMSLGLADMGAACITINAKRMALVDFVPYYSTQYGIVSNTITAADDFNFAAPFQSDLWYMLFGITVFTGLLVYCMEYPMHISNSWRKHGHRQPDRHKRTLSVMDPIEGCVARLRGCQPIYEAGDVVIYTDANGDHERGVVRRSSTAETSVEIGNNKVKTSNVRLRQMSWRSEHILGNVLTSQAQVTTFMMGRDGRVQEFHKPISRLAGNLIVCFGVFFFAIYQGTLAGFVVVQAKGVFKDLDDLRGKELGVDAERCSKCHDGCLEGDPKINKTEGLHAVEEYVDGTLNQGTRYCLPNDVDDMIVWVTQESKQRVRAIVDDEPQARKLVWRANQDKCKLQMMSSARQDFGYAFPKGSTLRAPMYEAVSVVNSQGIRDNELDPRFFPDSPSCKNADAEGLTVSSVWVLLIAYGCLWVALIIVYFIDHLIIRPPEQPNLGRKSIAPEAEEGGLEPAAEAEQGGKEPLEVAEDGSSEGSMKFI